MRRAHGGGIADHGKRRIQRGDGDLKRRAVFGREHVAAYLNTLETVKSLRARAFVPAHAAVTENIVPLAQYNIDKVLEIADIITGLCRTPQTFESVLQQLFRRFDLVMDFEQYALVGSTVRSYLAWGKDTGRLQVIFYDHRLLWQQA